MSPPDTVEADAASRRRHAATIAGPDETAHARELAEQIEDGRSRLEQLAEQRLKLERDYADAARSLEAPIKTAVTEARIEGDSWERIANILGMHKDTARRQYQGSSIDAGAPGPRLSRCGLQHADAAGWCRNGVAGTVELARTKGRPGPTLNVCRAHGEEMVGSGKYTWRQAPDPLPPAAQP